MTTVPTADEIAAFLARIDPTKIGRVDEPPPAFSAMRTLTLKAKPGQQPPTRPTSNDWQSYATAYAADPLCAAAPIAFTCVRDPQAGTTVISYFWK